MPRIILFEEKQHSFPDDATDQEISASIEMASVSQAVPRNVDNYFSEREKFLSKIAKERGLNTRDKNLARGVYMSPQETAADEALDYTPTNFKELADAIAAQKNPASKKILLDEQAKLNVKAPSFGMILGKK